jgi:hypothetical protein
MSADPTVAAVHPLVACKCGNDPIFWTTKGDCEDRQNCKIVPGTPPALFPNQLPSGRVLVGTFGEFLADNGKVIHRISSNVDEASIAATDLLVCILPSGRGIVETLDECNKDNAGKLGKILA